MREVLVGALAASCRSAREERSLQPRRPVTPALMRSRRARSAGIVRRWRISAQQEWVKGKAGECPWPLTRTLTLVPRSHYPFASRRPHAELGRVRRWGYQVTQIPSLTEAFMSIPGRRKRHREWRRGADLIDVGGESTRPALNGFRRREMPAFSRLSATRKGHSHSISIDRRGSSCGGRAH